MAAGAAFALDNERLKAELRAQNEFLTTMVDTAPSLLVTVDTEGRIRTLNPATLEASGYDDPRDVLGRHFWDIFIDPDERHGDAARASAPRRRITRPRSTRTSSPMRAGNGFRSSGAARPCAASRGRSRRSSPPAST